MNTNSEYIGTKLKEARLNNGLSLRGAAEKIGVSFTAIKAWEVGHSPAADAFLRACEVYGIFNFEYFIFDEDVTKKEVEPIETNLKEYRQRAGCSQAEMANRLNIKKSTYCAWERGEQMPNIAQITDCAEILYCSIDELIGFIPKGMYSDKRQEKMNRDYALLDESSKDAAAASINGMAMAAKKKEVSSDADKKVG